MCIAGMALLLANYPQRILAQESVETQLSESTEETADDVSGNDNSGSIESVTVDTELVDNEIIAVEMPIIDEEYMLDFYIDPDSMIYRTMHIPDGKHEVEENAHLLFHNWDCEKYAYSHNSDMLTVSNQSTVPINVTITAKIENMGGIGLSQDPDFSESDECAIYLAITDDAGNEQPLTGEGEVSLTVELQEAPAGAYVYQQSEETGEYDYAYLQNDGEIDFDSYSFWLTGQSNPNASWEYMSGHPKVTVTWHIEPIMTDRYEETDEEAEGESSEEISDEQDLENVSEEIEDSVTDDEEKDTNTDGDDNNAAENTDTSDATEDNADAPGSDTDKATDDQTDTESDDTKNDNNSRRGTTDSVEIEDVEEMPYQ